ncbi:MAG: ornithine carbamoyltransferase [Burkholderiaceae bacterium]|uniref:Ornithine carbamoyltransferase n=1 Tax=Roseateles toxinivorans TaxID=270368 RepID=A0A4V3CTB0_9BURK|nr:ornithine carbamoyltransferase [Roseateles toxinivorans]MBT9455768.1 ornithine carbamoyltransferase [Burkholderiaceae bacterium]MBT9502772.1 ornithine carbamoyltransferase [Burkholderiaceae bacterium]TDP71097.1 ornithine carbamoyltransferase [Roseateles toxinivorans]
MSFNLRNRSLLDLADFEPRDIRYLLDLAAELKRSKYAGNEMQRLQRKNIALVFEKASTRTRCAFEVAAHDQGAHVTYIDPASSQIGHKESLKDTARVLGRMYDGIEYRGFHQSVVEELARFSHVPVWNGLTDESHPTQILADLLTMEEFGEKPLHEMSFCYIGDARFNMGCSLLIGGVQMGMDVRIAAPPGLQPPAELVASMHVLAERTGARITIVADPLKAVAGADFIYTDVWVSMGEPKEVWAQRIEQLLPYQVTPALMLATGKPRTKFMHCLPALHNLDTELGRQLHEQFGLTALEVTDEVFESEASIVFTQAENRVHTIKAVLVATLA